MGRIGIGIWFVWDLCGILGRFVCLLHSGLTGFTDCDTVTHSTADILTFSWPHLTRRCSHRSILTSFAAVDGEEPSDRL